MSTYRLPHDVRDRLSAALAGRRNRDACMALATFLGRFWTAPRRLGLPFMLDRRALAPVEALGLTEARVRGAIRALERVRFLERMPTSGRTHQATPEGLHRKPIPFTFAADYRTLFDKANKRAAVARDRRSRIERSPMPARPSRPPSAVPAGAVSRLANSPKYTSSEAAKVYLGEKRSKPPAPSELNPALEAALERWKKAAKGQQTREQRYTGVDTA
jgi:hypothetical protein